MRLCARRFRGSLLVAAFLIGAGGEVVAQELQIDPKALDTTGASSVQIKRKGRKGADDAAATQAPGKAGGQQANPNRQFGELEGWSPGKAPPKPKDRNDGNQTSTQRAPVSVTPSGSMNVGVPF